MQEREEEFRKERERKFRKQADDGNGAGSSAGRTEETSSEFGFSLESSNTGRLETPRTEVDDDDVNNLVNNSINRSNVHNLDKCKFNPEVTDSLRSRAS